MIRFTFWLVLLITPFLSAGRGFSLPAYTLVTTLEGPVVSSRPAEVRRDHLGKPETGAIQVFFSSRIQIYDVNEIEETLQLTCGYKCDDDAGHLMGHPSCDLKCCYFCVSSHTITLTPRIHKELPAQEPERRSDFPWFELPEPVTTPVFPGLFSRTQLREKYGIDPQSLGDLYQRMTNDAYDRILGYMLKIPLDKLNTEAEPKPPAVKIQPAHWGPMNQPCVLQTRGYGLRKMVIHITNVTRVVGKFPSGNVDDVIEDGPFNMGAVWMPQSQPVKIYPQRVKCYCEPRFISPFGDRPHYRVGEQIRPFPFSETRTAAAQMPTGFEGFFFRATGVDINRASVSFEAPVGVSAGVTLPVGTRLIPDDKSVQEMVTVTEVTLDTDSGDAAKYGGYLASLLPVNNDPGRVSRSGYVRVHCAEFQKKEPGPNTRFTVRSGRDDLLLGVLQFYEKSDNRGPWDQARTWIYTDKTSFADINKRITSGVTRYQYLNALHDVSSVGALDMEDPKAVSLLEPELLLGMGARLEAVEWLLLNLAFTNPRGLIDFLDKNAPAFHMVFQGQLRDSGIRHVGAITRSLMISPNYIIRRAGGRFAVAAVPEAAREAFWQGGGLDFLGSLVWSEKEEDILQGLEVLEAYKIPVKLELIMSLAENSESEKVKAKATWIAENQGR